MKQKRNNAVGFTLIELLVVITIIVILSAIGMVSYRSASRSARNSRRAADMHTVRQALVLYRSDMGCYPDSTDFVSMVEFLAAREYLSEPLPEDPKFNTPGDTNAYQYVPDGGSCTPAQLGEGTASGFTLTWQEEIASGLQPQTLTNP